MDPWIMFASLCKLVVEEQNVYLHVTISNGVLEMLLFPYSEDWDDESDD